MKTGSRKVASLRSVPGLAAFGSAPLRESAVGKAKASKKSEPRNSLAPDSRRAGRAKAVPSDVRKLGRVLLDQQMWCFGRDVSRAAGNALTEYGFSKISPPDEMNAPSCYVRKETEDRRETRLWGFGIVYSEKGVGSLFLERRKFSPRLLAGGRFGGGVWRASDMPRCRMPRSDADTAAAWRLLGGISARLAEYEAWVRDEFGEEYRRRCIASWPKKTVPADGMAESWMELARFFEFGTPIPAPRLPPASV